jgi:DNA helicase INO80
VLTSTLVEHRLHADDEDNLRRHAARGAQAAVQAAKDKAKAFDQARPDAPLDRE